MQGTPSQFHEAHHIINCLSEHQKSPDASASMLSVQVADLNRGAFGFVQLAKDLETGEQVAIKFIERGDKASMELIISGICPLPTTGPAAMPAWPGCWAASAYLQES